MTLQSGSVCVKVLRLYYNNNNIPVMDVNKLFTIVSYFCDNYYWLGRPIILRRTLCSC